MTGLEQRDIQQIFYQLSSIVVFCCGFFFNQKPLKFDRINATIAVMLFAFLGAWIRSLNGWLNAFNFLAGFLVYLTIIRTFSKDDLIFVIKGVIWMCVLATIWLALQKGAGFDIRDTMIRNTFEPGRNSLFFHASSMGMYYAQTIPLILNQTWLGLLFLPVLKFSESAISCIAVASTVLFYYWFRKRILFWILLIPILIGGFYYTVTLENYRSFNRRIPLWGTIIQKINQCPIGYGLDSFANPIMPGHYKFFTTFEGEVVIMRKEGKGLWLPDRPVDNILKNDQIFFMDHPHNEYLWLGYDVGAHSFIILTFLFYFMWQRFRKSRKDTLTMAFASSLLAFVIFSIAQFPLHLARIGHFLPFIAAGFYISTEEEK